MLGPYPAYWLSIEQKVHMRYAHRLVADAFLGPIPKGMQVNHKDGDKARPWVDNLEIVTNGENRAHAYQVLGVAPNRGATGLKNPNASFGWATVCEIREAYARGEFTSALAARHGVSRQTIYRIGTGKSRKDS